MTEILLEKLLRSNFTFGFELEGCVIGDEYYGYSNYYDEDDEDYDYDEDYDFDTSHHYQANGPLAKAITNNLDHLLNKGMPPKAFKFGTMDEDVSIDPDNPNDDYTFEYASPVLECTPINFKRVVDMLYSLDEIGVYTNDSCGFHHHLSWEGITERDMIWVYINLCLDKEFRKYMSEVDGINLTSSRWSPTTALEDIANAIHNGEYDRVLAKLSDDKYRLFRIHPYGTIEWRGPRDFLNNRDLQIIKDFYSKFNNYINKIIEYNDAKVLFGTNITREELFQKLTDAKSIDTSGGDRELEFLVRTHGYHDRPLEYKTERGAIYSKRLLRAMSINPELLYNFIMSDNQAIRHIFKKGSTSILSSIVRHLYEVGVMDEKGFAQKLFTMAYQSTKKLNDAQIITDKFFDYVDFSELYEQLKTTISVTELFSFVVYSKVYIPYKEFYNLVVRMGQNYSLSDDLYTITQYAYAKYSSEEQQSLLLLTVRILYRTNKKVVSMSYSSLDAILDTITGEEKTVWNNRMIAALFNKPEISWLARLIIDDDNLDIKALIALCSRYDNQNSIYQQLNQSIKNKIEKYVN